MGRSISAACNHSVSGQFLDIVAQWVETLHGQGEIPAALRKLAKSVNADAALLQRLVPERITPRQIAVVDVNAARFLTPGRRSFARDILGEELNVMKAGSVVTLSEMLRDDVLDLDTMPELRASLWATEVHDVAVIRLTGGGKAADFLELQFRSVLSDPEHGLLAVLGGILSRTWQYRHPGIAEQASATMRVRPVEEAAPAASILDGSNPFALSRCEYRVCVLIKQGMLVKAIAEELQVQDSTIRSHLRSIYMKTETHSHVELLHRLTQDETGAELPRSA